ARLAAGGARQRLQVEVRRHRDRAHGQPPVDLREQRLEQPLVRDAEGVRGGLPVGLGGGVRLVGVQRVLDLRRGGRGGRGRPPAAPAPPPVLSGVLRLRALRCGVLRLRVLRLRGAHGGSLPCRDQLGWKEPSRNCPAGTVGSVSRMRFSLASRSHSASRRRAASSHSSSRCLSCPSRTTDAAIMYERATGSSGGSPPPGGPAPTPPSRRRYCRNRRRTRRAWGQGSAPGSSGRYSTSP